MIVCRKFGSVNSTIQAIWKNNKNYQYVRTERIEIKRFRQPERRDLETLLSGFCETRVTLYQWLVLFV